MTDLLTSLVDRALDRTPILQRRPPALFEPSAGASFSEESKPANSPAIEEQEIVLESRASPGEQKQFARNDSHLAEPPSPQEEPESPSVETRPVRWRAVHDRSQPQPVRDDDRLDAVSRPSVAESTRPVAEKPTATVQPKVVAKPQETPLAPRREIETIVERRVEREIIKEHETRIIETRDVPVVAQSTAQSKTAEKNVVAQPRQALQAGIKQPTPKEQTSIKPAQKKSPPRADLPPMVRTMSRARANLSPQKPAAPSIHVTIGRVEVRATPQTTAKAQPVRPAGPKMSLDDYLRSRGERN